MEILLGRVGLLILAVNVLIASIPRCDLLVSVLRTVSGEPAAIQDELMSCHGQPSSDTGTAVQISDDSPCQCLLQQFLSFPVQALNYQAYIVYKPQLLYEFKFDVQLIWSNLLSAIEPPYPKILV